MHQKKPKKYIAYYRVSTLKQGQSGLGLEAQQAAVQSFIQSNGGTLNDEFIEVESGKRDDNRPKLREALKLCKLTTSVLIVAKLDRLSRSVAFTAALQDAGTPFVCCDMPEANEMVIGIMAVMAQHERKMISQRTKAALQAAKARGVKLGNMSNLVPSDAEQAANARTAHQSIAKARANDLREVIADARQRGYTTLQSIADHLNSLGIASPRGGTWYAAGISRTLSYLESA